MKPEKPSDFAVRSYSHTQCAYYSNNLQFTFLGFRNLNLSSGYCTQKPNANKVSSMFAGTRDKCLACQNTVYPTEKVNVVI